MINSTEEAISALQETNERLSAECEELKNDRRSMEEILWYIVAHGKGREFFPLNLDGSPNLWFEKATRFAGLTIVKGEA